MTKRVVRENAPVEQTFGLYPLQDEFVSSDILYTAMIGGVGSGKTRAGATKALLKVAAFPKSLGIVAAPNFRMLRDSTLITMLQLCPERALGENGFNKQDMTLQFTNGSRILLRSCDDPDSLRGPNAGWFWLDEGALAPLDAWKILQGRLRQEDVAHQGWVTTTPKGHNWLYQEFVSKQRDNYKFWKCSTRENIFLQKDAPEYLAQLEESFKDHKEYALQEIEGEFVVLGGMLFFQLDRLNELINDCAEPIETREGHTLIWKRRTPVGKYCAGLDACWGQTGSYACLWILDWQTGDQVAEIHSRLMPDEMADASVKLCKEYNDAYLMIEANGEGKNAVKTALENGYGHRMYSRDDTKEEKYGFWTDDRTRPVILGNLEAAVRHGEISIRDREWVNEAMAFIRDEQGVPRPAEGNYSDRIMASALAWHSRDYAYFDSTSPQKIKVTRYS